VLHLREAGQVLTAHAFHKYLLGLSKYGLVAREHPIFQTFWHEYIHKYEIEGFLFEHI